MPTPRRLLMLNLAALSPWEVGDDSPHLAALAARGALRPLRAPAPSLTCPSHATLVTGLSPREHGAVSNGWYEPSHGKVFNWERSDGVLSGERLWEAARRLDPTVTSASLFWRFCTHSTCDLTLTERPTYFANGRKGADVYSSDPSFKEECVRELGAFPFFHFWGPMASPPSTSWILGAAERLMRGRRPRLLLCYAPGLDYEGQRFGPRSPQARAALRAVDARVGESLRVAGEEGYEVLVVSDYGFTEVRRAVPLNVWLREAGWLSVDAAANGDLLEPSASRAFAVCDNQVAHVYVRGERGAPASEGFVEEVRARLLGVPGVREVLRPGEGEGAECLGHARSGQLLAVAEPDAWFSYDYWLSPSRAPDFRHCVDIFGKPGFDPSELFLRPGVSGRLHLLRRVAQMKLGWRAPFDVVAGDSSLVRGARAVRPGAGEGACLISSWRWGGEGEVEMASVMGEVVGRVVGRVVG